MVEHWSCENLRRSSADAASAMQSLVALFFAGVEFYACNRGWTANVPLPDRGGLRGDFTSVERRQRVPRDRPQDRLWHWEIRHMPTQKRLQKGDDLLKSVPTDANVADLMTKHLAAPVGELLSKVGV